MKKIKLSSVLSVGLVGGLLLTLFSFLTTSCSIKPKIDIGWRTEDLECNVGNPISSTREWIWTTAPSVSGGIYKVDNYKDGLPPGILLNQHTGQLTGTCIQFGKWQARFTYQVGGYQINTSNVIDFLVSNHADTVPVNWVGDIYIDHNVDFSNISVGTSSYTGGVYTIREGFASALPTGVAFNNGLLSGKATTGGQQTSISYVYTCHGWNKNVSDIYKISVNFVHNFFVTGLSMNNGSDVYTIDKLDVAIRSLNSIKLSFADVLQYIFNNGYRNNLSRFPALGNCKKNGNAFAIIDSVYCYYGINGVMQLVVHFQEQNIDPRGNFYDNQSLVTDDDVV